MPTPVRLYTNPEAPTETTCENCNTAVSADFARVFGNDDNQVFACRDCCTFDALTRGAAANPDGPVSARGGPT